MTKCVAALDLVSLTQALRSQNMDQFTSRIIHMNPEKDDFGNFRYQDDTWGFASNRVRALCVGQWIKNSVAEVSKLLITAFSGANVGVLSGYMFEEYAHNFLAKGDVSSCKLICTSNPELTKEGLKIEKRKTGWFSAPNWTTAFEKKMSDLGEGQKSTTAFETKKNDAGQGQKLKYNDTYYWRPYSQNFPSFDSALGNVIFQITANTDKDKSCKLKDLKDWLCVSRGDTLIPCHVVKVVPSSRFSQCQSGLKVLTESDDPPSFLPGNVHFWVLGIPLEHGYESLAKLMQGEGNGVDSTDDWDWPKT
jgi:hypothetical protein